jgi:hypothetical protein
MIKMMKSGHTEETRVQIMKAALRGYYKMVENELMGAGRVNRPADEGKSEGNEKSIGED